MTRHNRTLINVRLQRCRLAPVIRFSHCPNKEAMTALWLCRRMLRSNLGQLVGSGSGQFGKRTFNVGDKRQLRLVDDCRLTDGLNLLADLLGAQNLNRRNGPAVRFTLASAYTTQD